MERPNFEQPRFVGNGLVFFKNQLFVITRVDPTKEVKAHDTEQGKFWTGTKRRYRFSLRSIYGFEEVELFASTYSIRKEASGVENYIDIQFTQ